MEIVDKQMRFAEQARKDIYRVPRELLEQAREMYRDPATGVSDRDKALEQAQIWFRDELYRNPHLFGEVHAQAPDNLVKHEEQRELKYGVHYLRHAARDMRENLDIDNMSDAELEAAWTERLQHIANMEVRVLD